MRIDIGANAIRPELLLNKNNFDAHELKGRGENIRGKVIDVNQNIVLIQTSSGKEFMANTVVPMENFIGEDMSFVVVVGSEGQILLKPELDEKKQNLLNELKIEDILNKLNKPITPENRAIIKNMIQSGIAINENSFKEIKSLTLAMNLMQKMPAEEFGGDKLTLPLDQLVRGQEQVENAIVTKGNTALPQEVSLKDIITLKGLKLEVNLQNLKALNEVNKALESKDNDIFGLKKLIENNFQEKGNPPQLDTKTGQPPVDGKIGQASVDPKTGLTVPLEQEENARQLAGKEAIGKFSEDKGFQGLKDLLSAKVDNEGDFKVSKEMIKELLTEITKASSKEIHEKNIATGREKMTESDLKLDIDKLAKDLKTVLGSIAKESELGKTIEREILPKTDIMKEFMREFQVNILPFQMDKYENIAQYYIKKNNNKKKDKEGITVAFSLDTFHYGNVRALLNYQSAKVISIDILTENLSYEEKFKQALGELRQIMTGLGYTNISLSTGIMTDKQKSLAEDKIYPNFEAKSFETWV